MATQESVTCKGTGVISKKRYLEIKNRIETELSYVDNAVITKLLQDICNILSFDPNQSTYTKERGQKAIQRRKERSKELGVSTYILGGGKAVYEKKKQAIINT